MGDFATRSVKEKRKREKRWDKLAQMVYFWGRKRENYKNSNFKLIFFEFDHF